jgi:hypothetical protein
MDGESSFALCASLARKRLFGSAFAFFAPLAPFALIGSEDWVAVRLPCALCGEKSGTSTAWKLFRAFFHSMEKVIHAMEKFFHTVEVPDF